MEPWERQPGESSQAYHAFVVYRDMGAERSTAKVAQELGKTKTLMDRWSSRWKWVSRAAAYDADLDRQQRQRREKELVEARDRHANLARLVQNKFLERMRGLSPEEIPVGVLTQMLRVATDVELRALGEPVERVSTEVSGPGGRPIRYEDVNLKDRLAQYGDIVDQIIAERAAGHSSHNGAGQPVDSARPDAETG